MTLVAHLLVALVALLHLWFMALESLLWTRPLGLRIFRQSAERAEATRVLALNQGLYNGFLGVGLLLTLLADPIEATHAQTFLLACVVVAGVVGAKTASRSILFVQAVPGAAALAFVLLAR